MSKRHASGVYIANGEMFTDMNNKGWCDRQMEEVVENEGPDGQCRFAGQYRVVRGGLLSSIAGTHQLISRYVRHPLPEGIQLL